jgi:hypothetical protein
LNATVSFDSVAELKKQSMPVKTKKYEIKLLFSKVSFFKAETHVLKTMQGCNFFHYSYHKKLFLKQKNLRVRV